MNKRNNYIKRCARFRSHTDINNYNKFLLELDKQNKTTSFLPNNSLPNEEIKGLINSIENTFNNLNYTNQNFTGTTSLDTCDLYTDPNLYETNDAKINTNINTNNINTNNINTNSDINSYANYINTINKEIDTLTPLTTLTTLTPVYKNKVHISTEIGNVSDLLKLIETYPDDKDTEYNINMSSLHKITKPLTELNNMIGMTDLKENIINQILFYIQNLHTFNASGNDFMHTVIYGPPGTGKTEIAKIIGSIFSKLGVFKKNNFKKVTRADLIAGYLGQTALKTRDVIKECLGGVLFIDEAYSLGNDEKQDSFSKECIDTLCEALSDHKDNLMVIIAGYETELNKCFFNYNQGLNSRFTWRFKVDEYSAEELYNIFLKKVNDGGWYLAKEPSINIKWFEKNKSYFKFYGRDIETLFAKTKIAHSRRVFCLEQSVKKILTIQDLTKGFEIYLKNNDSKRKDTDKSIMNSMYV